MTRPDLAGLAARESAPGSVVAEARGLLAAATPGPWDDAGAVGAGRWIVARPRGSGRTAQIAVVYGERTTPEAEDNAALIAAAPRLLAALADECEELAYQRSALARDARTLTADLDRVCAELDRLRLSAPATTAERARLVALARSTATAWAMGGDSAGAKAVSDLADILEREHPAAPEYAAPATEAPDAPQEVR